MLNATGLVLWMASDARDGLVPAATAGYDERLVSRIGSISRDDENLTAKAFRETASRTSKARHGSAAALAVPLVAPSGAVGVLSAELRESPDVDAQQLAIATIVAAQLSMLLANAAAPVAAATVVAVEPQAQGDAPVVESAPAHKQRSAEAREPAPGRARPVAARALTYCLDWAGGPPRYWRGLDRRLERRCLLVADDADCHFAARIAKLVDQLVGAADPVAVDRRDDVTALSPALSAAESLVTLATSAPPSAAPKYSASCGDNGLSCTPSRRARAAPWQHVEIEAERPAFEMEFAHARFQLAAAAVRARAAGSTRSRGSMSRMMSRLNRSPNPASTRRCGFPESHRSTDAGRHARSRA